MRRVIPIGSRLPLHEGPTGKTMLAFLPEEIVTRARAAAASAGYDGESIADALAEARELGYLIRVGDRIAGVGGLSAPVFDASGVIAVVTTSGPAERFGVAAMQAAAPAVVAACAELSALLGSERGAT